MSILTAKSIIFIEFENILCDTDTFVIQKIYDTFKNNRENCILNALLDKIERNGIENIKYISQVKKNMNPLIEYINDDIEDKDGIAYEIYNNILYAEYGSTETFDSMPKTIIGSSLDVLIMDENLEKTYIFCKNPTPEICEFIYEMYDESRTDIIAGDESDFLRKVPCTSYFISDSSNIQDIMECGHTEDTPVEIYVPEYTFNITEDTREIITYPPIDELTRNSSIVVNSIRLPIV